MRLSNGYTRFTGIALILGGILPVVGMAGMMALFAMPFSQTVFIPFDIAIATWLLVLGALVTRGVEQEPA